MHTTSIVSINKVIIDSIPLDKDLKRYFIKKYSYLCRHNGKLYAADTFSKARVVLMQYRADLDRQSHRDAYLSQLPFRVNGRAKQLLAYMDTQPHYVLDFLKLYCGFEPEPLIEVSDAAENQDKILADAARQVRTDVPKILSKWIDCLYNYSVTIKHQSYMDARSGKGVAGLFCKLARSHSWKSWIRYWSFWWRVFDVTHINPRYQLTPARCERLREVYFNNPSQYVDAQWKRMKDAGYSYSSGYELDLMNLAAMQSYINDPIQDDREKVLSASSFNFVTSEIDDDNFTLWSSYFGSFDPFTGESSAEKPANLPEQDFFQGTYVGSIHHIPKKGTVKRRSIAAPNRFIQSSMVYCQKVFENLLRRFPNDCTFNQSRRDKMILDHCNNKSKYAGSVDLHQATDHLPLSWGRLIIDRLIAPQFGNMDRRVEKSYRLFIEVSQCTWENDGIHSRWRTGQPLGCLPSFDLLGITHNCFLESISAYLGYNSSPYCVLGDDTVMFTPLLRKGYINIMQLHHIPLTLSKSYEGNLVEFAGKVFIKGQPIRFSSDHNPITFNNLFDYQRSTGVVIPYDHLPDGVKKRIIKQVSLAFIGSSPKTKSALLTKLARQAYCLAQYDSLNYIGGPLEKKIFKDEQLITSYYKYVALHEKEEIPDPKRSSYLVDKTGKPYHISHMDIKVYRRESRKDQWFKQKYRPCPTTLLIDCALSALKDNNAPGTLAL